MERLLAGSRSDAATTEKDDYSSAARWVESLPDRPCLAKVRPKAFARQRGHYSRLKLLAGSRRPPTRLPSFWR